MKSNLQLVLLVVFAVATGALGTLLLQSRSAEAQSRQSFTECHYILGGGWSHAGNAQHLQRPPGVFPVPRGWTVVGAGNGPGGLMVALCR